MGIRAVVRQGPIVVDEPTTLPEGTVLNLVVDDEGDELGDEERAQLHASMATPWAPYQAGDARPVHDVLAELRSKHAR